MTVAAPLVTVVVPVYNVEDYLAACLESIQFQTLEDLEVVMVDDGSTDGSRAIAERFAAGDPRFKLITQENGGLSRARNTGADVARTLAPRYTMERWVKDAVKHVLAM